MDVIHEEHVNILLQLEHIKLWGENINTVKCKSVTVDGVLDRILDLLATYTHDSEWQVITAPSLIITNHHSTH
jgi:hypothetical protein